MPPITWTDDGPEGSDDGTFAPDGVRVVIVREGKLEIEDQFRLDRFGGTLPAVSDRIVLLWPKGDPNHTEHYRVLSRHFIDDFAGDKAWWLLLAPEVTSDREAELFQMARDASVETRTRAAARSSHYEHLLSKRLESKVLAPKRSKKTAARRSTAGKPKAQKP